MKDRRATLALAAAIGLVLVTMALTTVADRLAPPPAAAQAKIVWKVQTTWPSGITLFQHAKDIGTRVEEMTGGRFKWEVLPVGAVVGAFEVLEAVNKGLVDAAHGWPGYWAGKNTAAALFGGTLGGPFGMRLEDFLAWMYHGGGEDLYNELLQKDLKMDNVMAMLHPTCCQEPLGWFKKPIRSLADFRGMKMRSSGLGVDLLKEMGISAVVLAGGEILPALERGVVDGVEWSNPASDIPLGFHQVAKYLVGPSARQPFGVQEMLISKKKWAELPADLKAVVRAAVLAQIPLAVAREFGESGKVFAELGPRYKVNVANLPADVIEAEIKAIGKVLDEHAKKNPSFARVLSHQKEYAAKVVAYHNWVRPPHGRLGDSYFKK
jgi:TRAP-type mannitol/chloroaromatic compound transport system substrate-binding protein